MIGGRCRGGRRGAEQCNPAPAARARARAVGLTLLFAACAACGGDAARPERRHADWDAYLASPAAASDGRVVMIGIDGAGWDYLRPLIEAGELPSLARLVREGASGRLRSIECHFTPPAWTSLATGVLPHRHGVYSFGAWDGEAERFLAVSSNDVAAPTVWDLASRAGRRVSVVGMPATWPPHPVNGTLVTGIMTPKTRTAPLRLEPAPERRRPADQGLVSHAPLLTGAFEDAHNVLLPTFLDTRDDGETRYDEVRLQVLRKGLGPPARRTLGEHRFPVGSFSPWIHVRLGEGAPGPHGRDGWLKIRFEEPGSRGFSYLLSPTFLRIRHPFTHPPELADELYRRFGYYLPHEFLSGEILDSVAAEATEHARWFFRRGDRDLFLYLFGQSDNAHHLTGFGEEALPIYRRIDAFLGEVMEGLPDDTTLVVASDHGFGAQDASVDLNQYLAGQGLLHWKREGVIDHARTLVFHNMWHLHFNRKLVSAEELARRGVGMRAGEAPEDALARQLARIAKEIRAPSGERFPVELVRLPEDAAGRAPDMAVRATPDFWVEFWNVDRPSPEVVRHLDGNERFKHVRDGIVIAWGPGVQRGRDLGVVDIVDVAPTLLDLLGLPVADDLDGALIPIRDAEAARSRVLHRVASFAGLRREAVDAPEDPSSFEETLRALGYVRD